MKIKHTILLEIALFILSAAVHAQQSQENSVIPSKTTSPTTEEYDNVDIFLKV
ncbi:MAG: hypothetical protein ACK5MK_13135 [Dysgonomonas sp.]